jgi:hypothetical protein
MGAEGLADGIGLDEEQGHGSKGRVKLGEG